MFIKRIFERIKPLPWKRIIIFGMVLYSLTLVGLSIFVATESKTSNWLITKHVNPRMSPLPHISPNDWCFIIAQDDFQKLSETERKTFAINFFNKNIHSLAEASGFSISDLKTWFIVTAINSNQYSSEIFNQFGKQIVYKNLDNDDFPQPSKFYLFWRSIINGSIIFYSLILTVPIGIIGIFIFWTGKVFVSRTYPIQSKIVVGFLILVIAGIIHVDVKRSKSNYITVGPDFTLFANDSYANIQGTWTSDVKLAYPNQTTKIQCFRDMPMCIETTATFSDNILNMDTIYWTIVSWDKNKILAEENSSECSNLSLFIDRKNETVTEIKKAKSPRPDTCAWITEHLVTYLTNGPKPYLDLLKK